MPFPRGVADNDLLNIMQKAMEWSCERLDLRADDKESRERVAFLVTGFMRAGEHNPEKLACYVVEQLKLPPP